MTRNRSGIFKGIIVTFCGLLVCANVIAKPKKETPPQPVLTLNCQQKNIQFSDNKVILNPRGETQQLFLLHNTSHQKVLLSHYQVDPTADAGWSSVLDPDRWSVISMDQGKFPLTCQSNEAGGEYLNCHQVLAVCDMPHAVFPRLNLGSYWAVENQSFKNILAEIKKRGIRVKINKPKKMNAKKDSSKSKNS